jgi:hypothetical protein
MKHEYDRDNKNYLANVPACIESKYKSKCTACNETINIGDLIFYHGATKGKWHIKCGNPNWKISGTPYAIRRSMAINYATIKIEDTLIKRIKLMLRKLRRESEMLATEIVKDPEVFNYLNKHKLISNSGNKFILVPAGRNWNVDLGMVQMPDFDEDIMDRDAEVEES